MRRRDFLKGAGASIGTSLLQVPDSRAESREAYLRQFKTSLHDIHMVLKTPDLQKFYATGGSEGVLGSAIEHSLDPQWALLEETEFDPEIMHSHMLLVGVSKQFPGGSVLRMMDLKKADDVETLRDAHQGDIAYGQAIPVATSFTLMPAHVLDMFKEVLDVTGSKSPDYDIALAYIAGAHFKEHQIAAFPPMTDDDIHGRFVAISGIRPDDQMGRSGRKTYGGIAMKITEPMARRFERGATDNVKRWLRRSMVVISNSLEAKQEYDPNMRKEIRPSAGMSGGIVGVHLHGKYHPCGMLWGSGTYRHQGTEYSYFLFHGPDVIQPFLKSNVGSIKK